MWSQSPVTETWSKWTKPFEQAYAAFDRGGAGSTVTRESIQIDPCQHDNSDIEGPIRRRIMRSSPMYENEHRHQDLAWNSPNRTTTYKQRCNHIWNLKNQSSILTNMKWSNPNHKEPRWKPMLAEVKVILQEKILTGFDGGVALRVCSPPKQTSTSFF